MEDNAVAQAEIHRLDEALTLAREAVRAKGADDLHFLHLYFTDRMEWLNAEAEEHGALAEVAAMIWAFEELDSAISEPVQLALELEV